MNTNTSLIPIDSSVIGGKTVDAVDARELHAFLKVGKVFGAWINDRISQYGFIENLDYMVYSESGKNLQGGRPSKEYAITLGMAKELSMVERNEKGKEARLYFIECESRAKSAQPISINDQLSRMDILKLAMESEEERLRLEGQLKEATPKVIAYDRIVASDDTLTITQAAKILGVKRDHLTKWMAANGWVYRQNKSWVAYKAQETAGRLVYKEAKYTDDNTGMEVHKPYCHITQKGLAKLAMVFQEKAA